MPDYRGHFEVHLTAAAGDADGFATWCRGRGLKCVRIVLARGATADQPMATWRRADTTLPAVRAEAERLAADATAAGFAVVRLKVEVDPGNADVPQKDAEAVPGLYFESHVKLRLPTGAPSDGLLAACERHAAHLSRNAFREGGGWQERFVTLRGYGVGWATAAARLGDLLAALAAAGESVVEHEAEYCVYDSNLALDAGWLTPDE